MYKRAFGTLIVTVGLILILGAVGLTVMNVRTDNKAAERTSEILERVIAELPDSSASADGAADEEAGDVQEETVQYPLPGQRRLRNLMPEPEMKTVLVDGREYIGVLTIPRTGSELPAGTDMMKSIGYIMRTSRSSGLRIT